MATKRAKAKDFIPGKMESKRLAASKKQNVNITDRVAANRAKTYVYGKKEAKRLAAAEDMNLYIDECMTCVLPEPGPFTERIAFSIVRWTYAIRMG